MKVAGLARMLWWQCDPQEVARRKQGWQSVGSEEMLASENLRQAAQRWLKQHDILHETLQRSSDAGVRTLLAKCGECQSCTRQWCFRQSGSELRVERVGECTERGQTGGSDQAPQCPPIQPRQSFASTEEDAVCRPFLWRNVPHVGLYSRRKTKASIVCWADLESPLSSACQAVAECAKLSKGRGRALQPGLHW